MVLLVTPNRPSRKNTKTGPSTDPQRRFTSSAYIHLYIKGQRPWRVNNRAQSPLHRATSTGPVHERKTGHMYNTGKSMPHVYATSVWVLLRPTWLWTLKDCETASTVYRRRLESPTICRYHYKGGTFSSVILRSRVLVRAEF